MFLWSVTWTLPPRLITHAKTRRCLVQLIEEFSLSDIWRAKNEDVLKYTWFRLSGTNPVKSRLDYFLVTADIANETTMCSIEIPHRTDHCLVHMSWEPKSLKRGRGFGNITTYY